VTVSPCALARPKAGEACPKRAETDLKTAEACTALVSWDVRPNVRAKLPAEAGVVSPV